MIGGLLCSTIAFALYPLVREPWHAFALALLAGTGIGSWLTMQSSLVATLTPSAVRHAAFAQQRVAANVGLGLGGFAGGLIVTWQFGFIVGPGVGGFILGAEPSAIWPAAASICLLGGAYSLVLERRLPEHAILTPLRASTGVGRRSGGARLCPPPRNRRGKPTA